MDMDFIEAQWILGMLPSERLPDIAVSVLEAGMDSSVLRMLAGLSSSDSDEAAELFEESLRCLGREQLPKADAARIYAKAIAVQILREDIDPHVGARMIWDASLRVSDPNFHDLDSFIYAVSEYEDRPSDREFFAQEIRKEARRIAQE